MFLHGKGGSGAARSVYGGVVRVAPGGNAVAPAGWGGPLQWLYESTADFASGVAIVGAALAPETCGQIVLTGFSNGGAMAAKILCRGESFGGRLVGVILADPVPDQVVDGCAPASGVQVRLTQSDWMNSVVGGGGPCPSSWTCQGNAYSLSAYAARVNPISVERSPTHASVEDFSYAAPLWH